MEKLHREGKTENPIELTLWFGVLRSAVVGSQSHGYVGVYSTEFQDHELWLKNMMPFLAESGSAVGIYLDQEPPVLPQMIKAVLKTGAAIQGTSVVDDHGCTVKAFEYFDTNPSEHVLYFADEEYKQRTSDPAEFDALLGMRSVAYFRAFAPEINSDLLLVGSSPVQDHFVVFKPYFDRLAERLLQCESEVPQAEKEYLGESIPLLGLARRPAAQDIVRPNQIVGKSPEIKAVRERIGQYAAMEHPILLLGKTGTGKGLAAKAIHAGSHRRDGPFIDVNVAELVGGEGHSSLIETQLFGWARSSGIYGADPQGRKGLVELANLGTLFLDEIGDMPLPVQSKLLNVLEEKKVRRVHSETHVDVNFRLITATNKDLRGMVDNGAFREDLYARIHVLVVEMPPLRDRREDLPLLAEHLLKRLEPPQCNYSFDQGSFNLLTSYDWPRNVRELDNAIRRAAARCSAAGTVILPEHLDEDILNAREGAISVNTGEDADLDANPSKTRSRRGWPLAKEPEALLDGPSGEMPAQVSGQVWESLQARFGMSLQDVRLDEISDFLYSVFHVLGKAYERLNGNTVPPKRRGAVLGSIAGALCELGVERETAQIILLQSAKNTGWKLGRWTDTAKRNAANFRKDNSLLLKLRRANKGGRAKTTRESESEARE